MLGFRALLVVGNLSRVLIVALALGLGLGAPIGAVQPIGCVLSGDCAVPPAEEPRESERLPLSFAGHAAEKPQRVVPATLPAAPAAQSSPPLAAAPFGERRELRHVRGKENLPDKTGPPSA